MPMDLYRFADRTPADVASVGRLRDVDYPPELEAAWPGRMLEWAPPDRCVVARGDDGGILAHVGVSLRDATLDGVPVKVGGIGGVMTHPDARGRRLAVEAIAHARTCFADEAMDFGVLFCEPPLISYYEKLDWRRFAGAVHVTQRGEPVPFTFLLAMVIAVRAAAPQDGAIDLLGPPW